MSGVTPRAIRKPLRAGTVRAYADGSIDVDTSNAIWRARREARRGDAATASEREGERNRALLTRMVANISINRRKAEQQLEALSQRDKDQASILRLAQHPIDSLRALLQGADPITGAINRIMADLGDLQAEALKLTRRG